MCTGYCRFHQEGVRQEVQGDVALHRRPQLRVVRYSRDEALHLLLLGTGKFTQLTRACYGTVLPSRGIAPNVSEAFYHLVLVQDLYTSSNS